MAAIDATLALLDALPLAGLPTGHAGVAAGPLILRDGDVFGRTVNLSARLSDAATDGLLLVPTALAATLPDDRYRLDPRPDASLQGIGTVEVVAVRRSTPPTA